MTATGPFPPDASTFSAAEHPTLAALDGPPLPWSDGSMPPACLEHLCAELADGRARRVLELGSGTSTVLVARLLHRRTTLDFRYVSIEHDPRWAGWVQDRLGVEGIADGVTVIHAPLVLPRRSGTGLPWYDEDVLAAALGEAFGGDPVDFLIVDGPPAYQPGLGLARYPAVPALLERLAPGAPVYLDDALRPGEREVIARWEAETPLRFTALGDTRLARAVVSGTPRGRSGPCGGGTRSSGRASC